jgi:hypothetical protein
MEPRPPDERLADVRPDPRPSPDHAGHDRWLVVRWTTDPTDLSPAETSQARALLAACIECAALAADLEIISRATATSVVPPRPRDFRLTPEMAASARGSIVDRLRRWFASPRSVAVRPLAGAGVAMGLVLVLLAPSLGSNGGTQPDPQVRTPVETSVLKATPGAAQLANPAGAEMDAAETEGPDPRIDMMFVAGASPSPASEGGTAMREMATNHPEAPVAQAPDEDAADQPPAGTNRTAVDDTTFALTLLGIVLAGVGLMVLVLSWFARRWQDPLLR